MSLVRSIAAPGLVGVVLAAVAGGCCFSAPAAPIAPVAPTVTPTGVGATPTPAAPPPVAIAPQSLTLGAGFAPDPTTVAVVAGGPVSGSTMTSEFCTGNYPAAPQITLTLTAALSSLRVVGRASEDTTLAVRFPDGRLVCDDDGGGYPNPAIDIVGAGAGTYQVYAGSFGTSGQGATATIGFTTNPVLQPAQLP